MSNPPPRNVCVMTIMGTANVDSKTVQECVQAIQKTCIEQDVKLIDIGKPNAHTNASQRQKVSELLCGTALTDALGHDGKTLILAVGNNSTTAERQWVMNTMVSLLQKDCLERVVFADFPERTEEEQRKLDATRFGGLRDGNKKAAQANKRAHDATPVYTAVKELPDSLRGMSNLMHLKCTPPHKGFHTLVTTDSMEKLCNTIAEFGYTSHSNEFADWSDERVVPEQRVIPENWDEESDEDGQDGPMHKAHGSTLSAEAPLAGSLSPKTISCAYTTQCLVDNVTVEVLRALRANGF